MRQRAWISYDCFFGYPMYPADTLIA